MKKMESDISQNHQEKNKHVRKTTNLEYHITSQSRNLHRTTQNGLHTQCPTISKRSTTSKVRIMALSGSNWYTVQTYTSKNSSRNASYLSERNRNVHINVCSLSPKNLVRLHLHKIEIKGYSLDLERPLRRTH
jgi:hypothetical protein